MGEAGDSQDYWLYGYLVSDDLLFLRSLIGRTSKERVIQSVQRLPQDASYRDVVEEIALLAAIVEAAKMISWTAE